MLNKKHPSLADGLKDGHHSSCSSLASSQSNSAPSELKAIFQKAV